MKWDLFSIDAIVLIALAVLFYKGYQKGLINQAIWLGSFLIAYLVGSWLCYEMADLIGFSIYNDNVTVAISFVVIFSLTVVAMYYVGKWLTRVVNLTVVGVVNSVLGGVLNGLIYAVLLLAVTALTVVLTPRIEKYLGQTITFGQAVRLEKWVMDQRLLDKLDKQCEKVEDIL